ncbi:MAG: RagB/SusD family nutrient uptake outer membrane protein [Tannerella sp.]|jgi:hypothetical protein|nr:RagB/SusD family nutrient uptake outer membrane protein [Tannerella sp.]
MKTRSIILIASLLIFLSSCNDWLDPEPLSIYTPENIYKEKAGLKAALIPLRKDIRTNFYGGASGNAGPSLLTYELMSSDYGVAGQTTNGMGQNFDLSVTPTGVSGIFYYWNTAWGPIKDANTIISRIDVPEWENEGEKNEVLAEAYFHRAYWYYLLVHLYGNIPFINKEHTAPKIDFYSHSMETILKKLQEDLEFSVKYLPENVNPGEINRAAGMHLLAKVYLANQEYDKAVDMASNIINSGKYLLMTERFGSVSSDDRFNVLWDLHRPENKSLPTNKEGILVCQDKYGYPGAQTQYGTLTMQTYTPWWSHTLWLKDPDGLRACVDAADDPQILAFGRGVATFRPGNYINYDIWANCGEDLRHDPDTNWMPTSKILINNPASKYYGQPVDFKYSDPIDSMRALFPWPHYKIYIPDEIQRSKPRGGNSDWYVFRLAETYLLRAEAYCWKGEMDKAAADLNAVRLRSKAPAVKQENVTIDYILDERARELYLEEPRKVELTRVALIMAKRGERGYSVNNFSENNYWFDRVINQGKLYNRGIVWELYEYKISPYHVFWPIPQTAIDANNKGRINQNIGYNGVDKNVTPLVEITDNQ